MSEKKKVLIITEPFKYGGMNLVALRLQQTIDADKFECTYCVRHDEERGPMDEYVRSTGVRVIYQHENDLSYFKSYKYYMNLFKNEHFDIVHSHYPFYSTIPMLAARKSGIKVRITHSHFSTEIHKDFSKIKHFLVLLYRCIMRNILCYNATNILACSVPSGEYLVGKRGFRKKGIILNNGIDTSKYELNYGIRNKIRNEFNIDNDTTVIGHIGLMYYIKNQFFLLDVFNEYQKLHPGSVLMLVGDGDDRKALEQKCKCLKIKDKVIFTGLRDDVNELLMAMDCMVFPSLHEGFPLTLVEAQAAKLPCIVSDSVIKGVKLNDNLCFCSLNDTIDTWCKAIDNQLKYDRDSIDISRVCSEFDLFKIAKKLEKIYMQ